MPPIGAWGGAPAMPPAGTFGMMAPQPVDDQNEISVKVGGFGPAITAQDLQAAFGAQGVGTMTDVYIPQGRTYGFLRFRSLSEAQRAVRLSGMWVGTSRITCELAEGNKRNAHAQNFVEPVAFPEPAAWGKGGPGMMGGYCQDGAIGQETASVKIGNLPPDTTPEEVCEAYAAQGIDSMTDCYIPQGKRFGFLRFTMAAEAKHALRRTVWIRGHQLDAEPAVGSKRTPDDMHMEHQQRAKQQRIAEPIVPVAIPDDPHVSASAPSVKVSGVPPGTTSEELHSALLDAGVTGKITDVYIPKGDRGFGFVRFSRHDEAEALLQFLITVRGLPLEFEIAVQERKVRANFDDAGGYGPQRRGPEGGRWGPYAGWGGAFM